MPEARELIVEQIPHLRRYARALVHDREQADDLVQDCLERAWSRMHLWKTGSNIRAWLFTILHNLHVNALRKRRTQPDAAPLDAAGGDLPVRAEQEDGLAVRDVGAAFARLSDEHRAAMMLIAVEDMTYEEAATVLDIPVGTLMSRIHRGRERLRSLLSDANTNEPETES